MAQGTDTAQVPLPRARSSLPPRSTSPPLPPRNNTSGLPPTYLAHLRGLLRQFLRQQLTTDHGLPNRSEPRCVWDDVRLAVVERAIWEGLIQVKEGGGLLKLDWQGWAAGSTKRREAWKRERGETGADTSANPKPGDSRVRSQDKRPASTPRTAGTGKGKGSMSDSEQPRGRSIISALSSATSTPVRSSSRAASVTSTSRKGKEKDAASWTSGAAGDTARDEDSTTEERLTAFYRQLASLRGFERYVPARKEEWEILTDGFATPATPHLSLPGAFPQHGQYEDYGSDNCPPELSLPPEPGLAHNIFPLFPTAETSGTRPPPPMVKPLICLHFPSPPRSSSTSTVHLARANSAGGESSGSFGSGSFGRSGSVSSKRGWFGGSGGRWSEMTVQPETLEVEFVLGRFTLPLLDSNQPSEMQFRRRPSRAKGHAESSLASSSAESVGKDEDQGEMSSAWSGTQRAGSHFRPREVNIIVSGEQDDVPRLAAQEGEVGVVGGTIIIRGVRELERERLERVVRLLLYTIQSMALELLVLDAFRIPREADPLPALVKPKPVRHQTINPTRTPSPLDRPGSPGLSRSKSMKEGRTKGFFHRLSKDTKDVWEGLLGRRRASGEMPPPQSSQVDEAALRIALSTTNLASPPGSADPTKEDKAGGTTPHPTERNLTILHKLEEQLLSTTPGLSFPMPLLLLRIQEEDRLRREKVRHESRSENVIDGLPAASGGSEAMKREKSRTLGHRLGGDVRCGLGALQSVLEGWEGWIRRQGLDVLACVGVENRKSPESDDSERSGESAVQDEGAQGQEARILCHRPEIKHHTFYDHTSDVSIRQFLDDLAAEAEDLSGCERAGCEVVSGEHDRWWISGGRRICGAVELLGAVPSGDGRVHDVSDDRSTADAGIEAELRVDRIVEEDEVDVWIQCCQCGKETSPRNLGEVARTFSWAKTLELLLYSQILRPPICAHPEQTTYHIRTPRFLLRLSCEDVPVFEARPPKLQVGPNVAKRKGGKEAAATAVEAVARGLQAGGDGMKEDGPGRSASDELKMEAERVFDGMFKKVELLRAEQLNKDGHLDKGVEAGKDAKVSGCDGSTNDELLSSLRFSRSAIVDKIVSTPQGPMNDARQALIDGVKLSQALLNDWIRKHSPSSEAVAFFKEEDGSPPEYAQMAKGIHVLPGSAIFVREEEPISLIAYTLSSLAYFQEIGAGANAKPTPQAAESKVSDDMPDAQVNGKSAWRVLSRRRDTPRELLPLRTVSKKRSEVAIPGSGKLTPLLATPSVKLPATATAEVQMELAEGKTEGPHTERLEELRRTIGKAAGKGRLAGLGLPAVKSEDTGRRRSSSASESEAAAVTTLKGPKTDHALSNEDNVVVASTPVIPRPRRRPTEEAPPSAFRQTASIASSPMTTALSGASTSSTDSATSPDPASASPWMTGANRSMTPRSAVSIPVVAATSSDTSADKDTWTSSVTSSFTSSFNTLLKLSTDVTDTITHRLPLRYPDRSLASLIGGSIGLGIGGVSTDSASLSISNEPLPHIEYTYTLADQLKLGCTVYFASQFDTLRRQCAIEKGFVASIERTRAWKMQGGKTKAGWWMTGDGRFVCKELVSKWNVSDTQALLDIAPAYFEHLASTHNKATALAKIVGFYTVKLHDLQTNTRKTWDLLIMENLFYKQEISRTFDLKGIEGRRVPRGSTSSTGFDGEWLDMQAKEPILLHPHARRILLESLANDTRFLTSQGIMDYSLLVGLDYARKELVVGLVDAVGSFGLWKRLESAGKVGLRGKGREGEVTIIPPDQYRERFEHAMRGYFLACPDKWSKTSRRTASGPPSLPSVL